MFQGSTNTNLDEKGRIIIPSKFRKHILPEANSVLNVTLGRDNCIWLFPANEWNKVLLTIRSTNPYTDEEVEMRRRMLFHTDDLLIDSQHRILIPQKLLAITGIKKEILMLGQIERIELWNPDVYEKYIKSRPDTYENVMQRVMTKAYNPNKE
ncbi:MAG TPA: division/cell wall cluster transcriptional repressor MraZ [Ignavibacteria bacterium]|jgi:MraZ protein